MPLESYYKEAQWYERPLLKLIIWLFHIFSRSDKMAG